ncbi:hypothetical protein GALMADRAFT_283323 [Galerina marginata CBS 339.88]|uniref:Hydrophobin n=1 Tax=Galerina marginata (strain CBS 339.88) TaxID=685588 RepID=A0A067SA55_GALM3|nr:hypothetical protein GALMADRAFT_283323 [Galerina marginata CBS 339.88]
MHTTHHTKIFFGILLWASMSAASSVLGDATSSNCAGTGGLCGPVSGLACCAGLTCTTENVCRGCAGTNGLCGSVVGGVACCAGLFCSTGNVLNSGGAFKAIRL